MMPWWCRTRLRVSDFGIRGKPAVLLSPHVTQKLGEGLIFLPGLREHEVAVEIRRSICSSEAACDEIVSEWKQQSTRTRRNRARTH